MDKNGKKLPTQGMLAARIIVGGYLTYLGFSLFNSRAESTMNPAILWVFIILFSVLGLYFVAKAIYNYVKGNYQDGAADVGEKQDIVDEPESEADVNVIEDNSLQEEIQEKVNED